MTDDDATGSARDQAAPVLRVVKGNPEPAELVALVAVLSANSNAGGASRTRPVGSWSAYWRGVRQPASSVDRLALRRGVGGWRDSARPR